MGTNSSIADVFFSKTQQRVLALLYGHTDRSYYLKEIIDWANAGRGSVQRELERMVTTGVLTKTSRGNQQHYQANPACLIYNELLSIVKKTFGVVDILQHALLPLDSEIDFAFVYGSVAKGEESASSDIDLFIASGSVAYADVMNALTTPEAELGRSVNPSIYSREDISKKLKQKNAFLTRVIDQPKLWVKGSDDDIREIR
jgi:predicted nucleotidyltransferase